MSGYLQRLFDRFAAPVAGPAPALAPGSPLARHDQRLGIASIAEDFGFGTTPDPLMEDGDDPVPPLLAATGGQDFEPLASPQEWPAAPRRADLQDRASTAPTAPLPGDDLRSEPGEQESAPPAPQVETPRAEARASSSDAGAEATTSRARPVPPSPEASDRAPVEASSRAPEPGERIERVIRETEKETVSGQTEARAAPEPARPRTPEAPTGEPGEPVPFNPAQAEPRFTELPQARPRETAAPAPIAAETGFDWHEVDRRIATALDQAAQSRDETSYSGPARTAPLESRSGETAKPAGFTTAAEASVIGPIGRSPRHRMLFGTRWR